MDTLVSWVFSLLAANPHFAVIITIISMCRMVFKPTCALIQLWVDNSHSPKLAALWQAVEDNKFFKAVAFLMDYFASIKLPTPAAPVSDVTQPAAGSKS